jgi:hypothetical protein
MHGSDAAQAQAFPRHHQHSDIAAEGGSAKRPRMHSANTNSSTNNFPPLSSIAHVISKTACMLQDPCHGRRRTTVVTHHIHVTAIILTKAQFKLLNSGETLVLSSRRAFMHVVSSQ